MTIYQHGARGSEVLRIQERLQALGLYSGAIDGIYGNDTQSAVAAFQRAEGIAVDGIVGPTTWAHPFEGGDSTFRWKRLMDFMMPLLSSPGIMSSTRNGQSH